jgi:glycosyltransferase involved in cell wall biosynthesis
VSNYVSENSEIAPNAHLEVIHYAFDPESPKLRRELIDLEKFSDKSSKLVVGTIGRLVPQKDFPTLFNAFELLKRTFPNSELRILGSGWQKKDLEFLANNLGISDSIFFEGRKSNVNDFLLHLDFFVLTSRYEGFGLVLLEAMNLEIPIVASNNSAIPEVLGLKHPGLAETGNAIDFWMKITALTLPSKRLEAIEIQNHSFADFSPSKLIEKMDEVYRKFG